ncbi:MAG: hypothetical protein ABIL13_07500 [candidate division WOR-3 bacterium]
MIWLIMSQVISVNPFTMWRDVNRLSVDIYDQKYQDCQECVNELMNAIQSALRNNVRAIHWDDFKKVIYIKLNSYTEEDSIIVVKVLEERGVNGYVVSH